MRYYVSNYCILQCEVGSKNPFFRVLQGLNSHCIFAT